MNCLIKKFDSASSQDKKNIADILASFPSLSDLSKTEIQNKLEQIKELNPNAAVIIEFKFFNQKMHFDSEASDISLKELFAKILYEALPQLLKIAETNKSTLSQVISDQVGKMDGGIPIGWLLTDPTLLLLESLRKEKNFIQIGNEKVFSPHNDIEYVCAHFFSTILSSENNDRNLAGEIFLSELLLKNDESLGSSAFMQNKVAKKLKGQISEAAQKAFEKIPPNWDSLKSACIKNDEAGIKAIKAQFDQRGVSVEDREIEKIVDVLNKVGLAENEFYENHSIKTIDEFNIIQKKIFVSLLVNPVLLGGEFTIEINTLNKIMGNYMNSNADLFKGDNYNKITQKVINKFIEKMLKHNFLKEMNRTPDSNQNKYYSELIGSIRQLCNLQAGATERGDNQQSISSGFTIAMSAVHFICNYEKDLDEKDPEKKKTGWRSWLRV